MSSNIAVLADNGLADHLPVEMTDIIFDSLTELDYVSLRPSRESISACSLVCKSWAHRTLRHRFRSISLTVESQASECGQEEFSVWTYLQSDIFKRTQDAVQTVSLRCKGSVRPDAEQQQQVHTLFHALNIQSLKLDGIASMELLTLGFGASLSLRRLVITDSSPHPERSGVRARRVSNALHHVLCSFASIDELHILSPHVGWLTAENNAAELRAIDDRPPARVGSLVVRFAQIIGLVPFVKRLCAAAPLEKLDILGQPGQSYFNVFMAGQALNSSLRHLLFSISPIVAHTQLRAFTGLQHVTIAVELYTPPAGMKPPPRHGLAVRVVQSSEPALAHNVMYLHALSQLLQALYSESRVEHVQLLFVPAPDELALVRASNAQRASLPDVLGSLERELRACEDALVRLVQERGLKRVSMALSDIQPWAQNLDTAPFLYGHPTLRILFAQLDKLGVLDC